MSEWIKCTDKLPVPEYQSEEDDDYTGEPADIIKFKTKNGEIKTGILYKLDFHKYDPWMWKSENTLTDYSDVLEYRYIN
jgi:hypothetical protein